jgi:hypothetical protein
VRTVQTLAWRRNATVVTSELTPVAGKGAWNADAGAENDAIPSKMAVANPNEVFFILFPIYEQPRPCLR